MVPMAPFDAKGFYIAHPSVSIPGMGFYFPGFPSVRNFCKSESAPAVSRSATSSAALGGSISVFIE